MISIYDLLDAEEDCKTYQDACFEDPEVLGAITELADRFKSKKSKHSVYGYLITIGISIANKRRYEDEAGIDI
jgi:hypothetical protein